MNKKIELGKTNTYSYDAVAERGRAIFDGWKQNRLSSRRILALVKRAVSRRNAEQTDAAAKEALSHLLALEQRVTERYRSVLRCLLAYSSWRRETRALKVLKKRCGLPGNRDLQSGMAEQQKTTRTPDSSQEGKGNSGGGGGGTAVEKAQELRKASARVSAEPPPKQTSKKEEKQDSKTSKKEEKQASKTSKREEKRAASRQDGKVKKAERKNPKRQSATDRTTREAPGEESAVPQKERYIVNLDDPPRPSVRTQRSDGPSPVGQKDAPGAERSTEQASVGYNHAVDSPPMEDFFRQRVPAQELSFIDEVIIDNMIKGKRDFVNHNPLLDVKEAPRDTAEHEALLAEEERLLADQTKEEAPQGRRRGKAPVKQSPAESKEVKEDGVRVSLRVDLEEDPLKADRRHEPRPEEVAPEKSAKPSPEKGHPAAPQKKSSD